MNRAEFEAIRNIPGKMINGNIVLVAQKTHTSSKRAEKIEVHSGLPFVIQLDVTEKPGIPSYTFNFAIPGVGPICRLCINGPVHPGAGRTHKHEVYRESDPANNLPTANELPNLATASLESAWRWLCIQANITHAGEIG